ncbi:MAG: hypothetical protein ACKESB_00595 [Candidatus Hodgkinia cicadicola]
MQYGADVSGDTVQAIEEVVELWAGVIIEIQDWHRGLVRTNAVWSSSFRLG